MIQNTLIPSSMAQTPDTDVALACIDSRP